MRDHTRILSVRLRSEGRQGEDGHEAVLQGRENCEAGAVRGVGEEEADEVREGEAVETLEGRQSGRGGGRGGRRGTTLDEEMRQMMIGGRGDGGGTSAVGPTEEGKETERLRVQLRLACPVDEEDNTDGRDTAGHGRRKRRGEVGRSGGGREKVDGEDAEEQLQDGVGQERREQRGLASADRLCDAGEESGRPLPQRSPAPVDGPAPSL